MPRTPSVPSVFRGVGLRKWVRFPHPSHHYGHGTTSDTDTQGEPGLCPWTGTEEAADLFPPAPHPRKDDFVKWAWTKGQSL